MSLQVDVLGAGCSIGRSCLIVTWDFGANRAETSSHALPCKTSERLVRIMFDCGMHVGDKKQEFPDFRRWLGVPLATSDAQLGVLLTERITAVLLTHFHLDHIGAVPLLLSRYEYKGLCFATFATRHFGELVLMDAFKDSSIYFSGEAVAASMSQLRLVHTGSRVCLPIANGHSVQLFTHGAGHVAGAVMFEVVYKGRSCIYSGDVNVVAGPLTKPLSVSNNLFDRRCDLLVSESTYAGYEKEGRCVFRQTLAATLQEFLTFDGAKMLVPCLSVGKAQEVAAEVLLLLKQLKQSSVAVYLSGYSASKAVATFRLLQSDTVYARAFSGFDALYEGESKLLKEPFRYLLDCPIIEQPDASFWHSSRSLILIASPSLLTGGVSLQALQQWAPSSKNFVVFLGSCLQNTLGQQVLVGVKVVTVPGRTEPLEINCKVRYCPLAIHAGQTQLSNLIKAIDPAELVLVHGDAEPMQAYAGVLSSQLGIKVHCPENFASLVIGTAQRLVSGPFATFLQEGFEIDTSSGFSAIVPATSQSYSARGPASVGLYARLKYPPAWPEVDVFLSRLLVSAGDVAEDGEISELVSDTPEYMRNQFGLQFIISLSASAVRFPRAALDNAFPNWSEFAILPASGKFTEFPPPLELHKLNRSVVSVTGPLRRTDFERLTGNWLSKAPKHCAAPYLGAWESDLAFVLDIPFDDLLICVVKRFQGDIPLQRISSTIIELQSNCSVGVDRSVLASLNMYYVFIHTGRSSVAKSVCDRSVASHKIYSVFAIELVTAMHEALVVYKDALEGASPTAGASKWTPYAAAVSTSAALTVPPNWAAVQRAPAVSAMNVPPPPPPPPPPPGTFSAQFMKPRIATKTVAFPTMQLGREEIGSFAVQIPSEPQVTKATEPATSEQQELSWDAFLAFQ